MNSASDRLNEQLSRHAKRVVKREYDRAVQHFCKLNYLKTKASINKILNVDPKNAAANTLLARVALSANDFDTAGDLISNVLINNPNYVDAHKLLGEIFLKTGSFKKAEFHYRQVLALRDDDVDGFRGLGDALKATFRISEAELSYRNAIEIRPGFHEIHFSLGMILRERGEHGSASVFLRNAAILQPECGLYWTAWAGCLSRVAFVKNDEFLFEDLQSLLKQPTISPGPFVRSIISALYLDSEFLGIFKTFKSGKFNSHLDFITAAKSLSTIPLLLRIMEISPITVPEIEDMLQGLRRGLLSNLIKKNDCLSGLEFLAALAQLCFNNEYLFEETAEETSNVISLEIYINKVLKKNDTLSEDWLLIIAAYRPLHTLSFADHLLDRKWPEVVKKVIIQQVIEPLKERSLRALVPALTTIKDHVSLSVHHQYEENPYPTWVSVDLSDYPRPIEEVLSNYNIFLQDVELEQFKAPEILIAGCGTGKQSINAASKYLHARIMAVDLSRASLAYAMRKSNELGYEKIEYAQGDILELIDLGRKFNIIECTGVLHHMKDPLAGWQVLEKILYPGGLMRIALYSEVGRKDVKKAQAFVSERNFQSSSIDIRRCRKEIINMSLTDSNMKDVVDTVDFYSMSGCRDMIFHTHEHRFTLLEIKKSLELLDLSFLGFELPSPEIIQQFQKIFPESKAIKSLDCWHKFELENPELFKGMYVFWIQKNLTD
jgi:2-polyprenyl-3-methyl-5-hydroxy-6-metoxy-1,4-benzoquinol methylase/tetratricopeptide (TPR) repeat protein